jgi:hemoglobin/transferrin/lactoferrin receptor protein
VECGVIFAFNYHNYILKFMIKKLLSGLVLCSALNANAQIIDSVQAVVITGNKYEQQSKKITQQIDVISKETIANTNAPSTGDLLMQSGKLFVQKSQLGGSSPVIRGFEANRILLVIDGVRMNNGIYRGGHLQNVITVDQSMLNNVEIAYGPASTLYGSDALGGAIQMTTKKVLLNTNKKTELQNISAFARYSSACNEGTGHVDFTFADRFFGSLTSITYSNFGDLRAGANRSSAYGNVGLRNFTVQPINGKDSMVPNSNPQLQTGTGYMQYDILQKFFFSQSNKVKHNFNIQFSNSGDVPRYDRLSEVDNNGIAKNAEWYYGPQKRLMGSYKLELRELNGFFNQSNILLAYQNIEESRNTRSYRKEFLTRRAENLDVVSADVNARHLDDKNDFVVGADLQYTNAISTSKQISSINGSTKAGSTRYADGGNNYTIAGIYAQNNHEFLKDKVYLNTGLRYNYTNLMSKFDDTTFYKFPFKELNQTHGALTGNLGLNYFVTDNLKLAVGYASGFKSPNIDDAAKVFETAKGVSVIVPNENLKSERAHTFDATIEYNDIQNDQNFGITGFYTILQNAMVLDYAKFNGADSISYDGTMTRVISVTNQAQANIYGVNIYGRTSLTDALSLDGTITLTRGELNANSIFLNPTGIQRPMDHIPPTYGRLGINYKRKIWYATAWALFNGEKSIDQYNPLPGNEDNLVYATPTGMPAWFTLNVRGGYTFNKNYTLQAGVENILDTHYRHFASGISAPGRNIVITARYNFSARK